MQYIAWWFRCLYASYLANVCAAHLRNCYILDSKQNFALGNGKTGGDAVWSGLRLVDQILTFRLDNITVCVSDDARLIFDLFLNHKALYDEWIVRLL